MDKSLVDWYSSYTYGQEQATDLSRTVVADAFFSKETFITPMCENDFLIGSSDDVESCTIDIGAEQENVVIPSGLTAGLTLPIWI